MTTKISDSTNVQMPMKTVISLLVIVSCGALGYANIIESINKLSTKSALMESNVKNHVTSLKLDIEKNTTFRIERPQSPAVKEAFLLIEYVSTQLEKLSEKVEKRASNSVNISRLQADMLEVRSAVEKLKDAQRHLQITGK